MVCRIIKNWIKAGHNACKSFKEPVVTAWLLLLHLLNGLLPIVCMAVFMPWLGRWVLGRAPVGVLRRTLVHVVLGVLVWMVALALTGEDGSMVLYASWLLVWTTAEWVMHRAWRQR